MNSNPFEKLSIETCEPSCPYASPPRNRCRREASDALPVAARGAGSSLGAATARPGVGRRELEAMIGAGDGEPLGALATRAGTDRRHSDHLDNWPMAFQPGQAHARRKPRFALRSIWSFQRGARGL
jgi:hypothetical protein